MKIAKTYDVTQSDDDLVLVGGDDKPKASKVVATVLIVVGALTLIGAVAYFLCKYLKPNYLEDCEEDFDEDFDDIDVED